jgi:hypothetical protein
MKILLLFASFAISSIAFGQVTPFFTLEGNNTIVKELWPNGQASIVATFNVGIEAFNGDYTFDLNSFAFSIYRNGVKITPSLFSAVSFSAPSAGVITSGLPSGALFKLPQGNEITIPVTFLFNGPTTDTGFLQASVYAVGFDNVNVITGASGTRLVINPAAGLTVDGRLLTASIAVSAGEFQVVSAIPEPATYAGIVGAIMLGIAAWRRRTGASTSSVFSAS